MQEFRQPFLRQEPAPDQLDGNVPRGLVAWSNPCCGMQVHRIEAGCLNVHWTSGIQVVRQCGTARGMIAFQPCYACMCYYHKSTRASLLKYYLLIVSFLTPKKNWSCLVTFAELQQPRPQRSELILRVQPPVQAIILERRPQVLKMSVCAMLI